MLPPRPATLPLAGVPPCALLAGPQVRQLGVGPGTPFGSMQLGDARCMWSNASVSDTWLASPLLDQGAAVALRDPDAQVTQVSGFPAVQTSEPAADVNHSCELYLDLAPGQSLLVDYINNGPAGAPQQPMSHSAACEQAKVAAALMIQTLRQPAP